MTKKEKMEMLLSKVAEDQKADLVAGMREAKSKDEWLEVVKKYGIRLSEDEKATFKAQSNEVSDEELDAAAGGCCHSCECTGNCACAY